MEPPEFVDPQGDLMVPLRCGCCDEQIGLQSPGASDSPDVIARCYRCAAVQEAEVFTREAADALDSSDAA